MVRLVHVQNTKNMSAYRELTICQREKCLNHDLGILFTTLLFIDYVASKSHNVIYDRMIN